ncbi:MAG: adenosine deaminase, partial [Bacillota bacterium]|nr:adenosine deaminase [Bacillota bacterium]
MKSFPRRPLYESFSRLAAVARGDLPATLVIQNARLLNVLSEEILAGMSVAVSQDRIAYVGPDPSPMIGPETLVLDAQGRYLAPGLLDGHCHVESSQITVTQFARALLPRGVTGIFYDAHEIANVLGLKGLRLFLEESRRTPLLAYLQVPSCVPAAGKAWETSGAEMGPSEVAQALSWGDDVIGLGEVMNFPGVVLGDPKMAGEIAATLK